MKRTVSIHIAVWLFLLLFPLLFYHPDDTLNHTIGRMVRTMGSPLSYMVVFYLNYLWLIPRVYLKGNKKQFFIINAVVITCAMVGVMTWWDLTGQILPDNRPPIFGPDGKPLQHRPGMPPPRQAQIFYNFISLILTVALSLALRLIDRTRQLEAERKEIERMRSEAELSNLRSQLNPHFLLNTLNNIYALIAFDSDKAQHAVEELSKLLRYMLYENESNYVPLYKEVEFINNYIELMRMRLAPSVKVDVNIQVSDDNTTPVAPLLFISLIENAFKHGISSSGNGYINISLHEDDGNITCFIINSNNPKNTSDKSGSGIGLEQVERRLNLQYPGRHKWTRGLNDGKTQYYSKIEIFNDDKVHHS